MKRQLVFLPLSTLAISAATFADSTTIQVPEGKITNHMTAFDNITPSAGPRVIDGYGLYLTADYLYWTAREDNLSFASSGTTSEGGQLEKQGRKYSPRFKYTSGFKAGIGFNFGHDGWDMYLNYTWLNPHHNHKRVYGSDSLPLENLIPVNIDSIDYSSLSSASSSWSLNFNVIDWELGRSLYISKFLSLRPFIGFKGTWQKQSLNIEYNFIEIETIRINGKNDFWGVGPMIGLDTTWHLPGTWSLFGDFAVSSLWGGFSVEREDKTIDKTSTFYDVKAPIHTVKPVLEMSLGIRKEEWFYADRYHFSLQVGWEQQVWFSQNQFDFYTDSRSGDLTTQGVTAKARFDF
jgi:hypothetical protein